MMFAEHDAWYGSDGPVREGFECPVCGRDSCDEPEHLPPEEERQGGEEERKREPSSWVPVNLDAILNGDGNEDRPSVLARRDGAHLLYPGCINSLVGEPESLKSWVAQSACVQELEAGQVVLYIDHDDSARSVVGRLLALGADPDAIRERFLYVQPSERLALGEADLDAAMERRPSLVVIDGMTDAMTIEGLNLNDAAEVATFYQRLPRRLAKSGSAVLLLDHVVKSKEGRGRWAFGSQHKLAAVNGSALCVEMSQPFGRGKVGRAKLYLAKDRRGHVQWEGKRRLVAEIEAVSREDDSVVLILSAPVAAEDWKPTALMERCSRELERRREPASLRSIRETTKGKAETLGIALGALVDEGYASVEEGTRGATLYTSIRPYRQNEDTGSGSRDSGNRSEDPGSYGASGSDRFPTPVKGEGRGTGQRDTGAVPGTGGEPVGNRSEEGEYQ